ncbi:MAG: taurine dioxygenase [Thiotrichales bacterium]|nr:taurine dioxygenase [Thiotrichales bacterium]
MSVTGESDTSTRSRKSKKPASKPSRATKSDISISKASQALGALVTDIDLSKDFSDSEIATLRDAFNTHGLLLFRDQDISPEAHVAFSKRFGELEHHVLNDALLEGLPEIYILSNLKKNGKRVGRAGAGHYWHSDLSYMAHPSLGSLLRSIEVPEVGGDTMFANLAVAYDALSEPMKEFLEGLEAEHSFANVQKRVVSLGLNKPLTPEQLAQTPSVVHPLVREHPETGRKSLFLSPGFTTGIVGMTNEESAAILEFLADHASQPRFVYRHAWKPNDVVFWDNRTLMHYAINDYDYENDRRHMHRTTIRGERAH